MSIPAIGPVGFTPLTPPTMPTPSADPAANADFGNLLSKGLENLQGLHSQADSLAVKAATGDLTAMHDYTITATEASVATQLTTAVRNKALEAFQEIMRMSV
jgi:flagellar hook-basal body complex protein FliE